MIIAASLGAASPASAQGLLDFLFGGGSPAKPAAPKAQVLTPGGRSYDQRSVFAPPRWPRAGGEQERRASGGTFRTVCVRMCDGYYFPISSAATRDDFLIDQNRCSATCGTEARLFYVPASRPEMTNAVDISGRLYSALPNAFRYRKSLVSGCACRAAPWSEAELARHQRYAEAEERRRPRSDVTALEDNADQLPPMARAALAMAGTQASRTADEPAASPTVVAAALPRVTYLSTLAIADARNVSPAPPRRIASRPAAGAPSTDAATPADAPTPAASASATPEATPQSPNAQAAPAAETSAARPESEAQSESGAAPVALPVKLVPLKPTRPAWTVAAAGPATTVRRQRSNAGVAIIHDDVKPARRKARSQQQIITVAGGPAPQRRRTPTVSGSPSPAMPAMGLGAGGMVWPGDPQPQRRRG